jgi:hypothetical protein
VRRGTTQKSFRGDGTGGTGGVDRSGSLPAALLYGDQKDRSVARTDHEPFVI